MMYIFPYLQRKFVTPFSPGQVKQTLEKFTREPVWTSKYDRMLDRQTISGIISEKEFEIVRGDYNYYFRFRSRALLPVMKGQIVPNDNEGGSQILVSIQWPVRGMLFFIFGPLFGIVCLFVIDKRETTGIVVISIVLVSIFLSYLIGIIKFNREVKKFINFLEEKLRFKKNQ